MQFNAYTISLFASALISGGLAVFAWRRRSVTAGPELTLLMFAVAVWSLCVAIEGVTTVRFWKIFWSATAYLGSQSTPVLFLLFVLRYTQQDKWLNERRIALLWAIPAVTVVIAFTNGLHGFLWSEITITNTWAGVTDVYAHGPWYWVSIIYGYALVILGIIALLRSIYQLPRLYSRQIRMILLATLAPIAGHLVYTFIPSSVKGLDITPIAFTLTGGLIVFAVFRYKLLDLRPIASNVLYEGIRDPMVAVDAGNRVVDINPAAQKLVGGSADESIGRGVDDVFLPIPGLVEQLSPGLEGPQGEIESMKDGERRCYDLHVWPLRDHRDNQVGRLITLHDVTEIRLAQEELERINVELDGFAHTVSHDLKGPLTTISLANEAVEKLLQMPETGDRNDSIREMMGVMSENTKQASLLIKSVLALAKAGQRPVELREVQIEEAVQRILEEKGNEIDERGAELVFGDLGSVRADPTHVYQLFSNIIGNAIKHCDSPSPRVEIRLLDSGNGEQRYLIRDNGSGIPPDDLELIFKPFYMAGKTGTTGIGLSTAKRIVEVYGGEIKAYNDRGACFEFTLIDYPEESG